MSSTMERRSDYHHLETISQTLTDMNRWNKKQDERHDELKTVVQENTEHITEFRSKLTEFNNKLHEHTEKSTKDLAEVNAKLEPIVVVAKKVKYFFEVLDCLTERSRGALKFTMYLAGTVTAVVSAALGLKKFFG